VLVAQNHRFMTDPNGAAHLFRDQIFAKLNEGLSIDIVAMHPNVRPDGADDCDARRVWGFSSGSAHFDDHLKDCWRTFNNWSSKYRKESASLAGKLRIFGAYLLPLSVKIVDPESEDGFAVLSPRLMEQFANGPRPQFIVTRRYERVVFNFYWSSISTSFDNAGWKLSNKIPKKPMYV
jgi:hypothetical protein